MTSRERSGLAAESFWNQMNQGGANLIDEIQRAIDEAVAEAVKAEREINAGILADESMLWADGNDDAKQIAIEALRSARNRIRARGAK